MAAGDRLFGVENVRSGAGDDRIVGDGAVNVLQGRRGDDHLVGGDGDDRLLGSRDDDRLQGGDGWDRLLGGEGHDWLRGGAGSDTLSGGTGVDMLWGGRGADLFRFHTTADSTVAGRDTVADFDAAAGDRLDFARIDADRAGSCDGAFDFIGAGGFSSAGAELRAAGEADSLRVEGDVDGDGSADFAVLLSGTASIAEDAFIL